MILPVKNHVITSPYGDRTLNGVKQFHDGIDFISRESNEVFSILKGIVIFDQDDYDYLKRWTDIKHSAGNYLIIKHSNDGFNFFARYLHLGENYVTKNDVIEEGYLIGRYANAGISYGAHLHFDVYTEQWGKVAPHYVLAGLL